MGYTQVTCAIHVHRLCAVLGHFVIDKEQGKEAMRKKKLLFVHIPKTAGVYFAEYISDYLSYSHILSKKKDEHGVWMDFTLDEIKQYIHCEQDEILLHTHTLSYGWSDLAYCIPWASKEKIIAVIKEFKENGWFTFAFVRHPGEMLCSFYHYVYDFHEKGEHTIVAAHAPVIDRSLDRFVSEHCDKKLLPDYWEHFDFVAEASNDTFSLFFRRYFHHDFQPDKAPAHASGSKGYAYYCAQGTISEETQIKVEQSWNMKVRQAIIDKQKGPSRN